MILIQSRDKAYPVAAASLQSSSPLQHIAVNYIYKYTYIQSGASSLAKHGGAYFSAVYGSLQDPIAAPGLFDIQVP